MLFDDACRHHLHCCPRGALKTNKSKSQESKAEQIVNFRTVSTNKPNPSTLTLEFEVQPTVRLRRIPYQTIFVNNLSFKPHSVESKLPISYQVSHNNFWACANCQVQRRSVRRVLDSRVDIGRHANKKQDSLDVNVLYRQVKEVAALGVELEIKVNSKELIGYIGNNLLASTF